LGAHGIALGVRPDTVPPAIHRAEAGFGVQSPYLPAFLGEHGLQIVPPRLSATALTLYGTVGIAAASAALTLASGALYGAVGAGGFWVMAGLCAVALPIARRL
jgi:hypothetical protein